MYEEHLMEERVDKMRILRTVEVITACTKAVNYLDKILKFCILT